MILKTFLLLIFPILFFSQSKTYKVIGIKDGDTVELFMDGTSQVVRLSDIDCPEKKQPYGNNARQFISDLCFGKYVMINEHFKRDRNKRIISEIILTDGTNVNKELVRNGLAWHYKKYSKDPSYEELESDAKREKIGLWKEEYPVAPWEWRKQSRSPKRLPSYSAF